MGLTHLNIELSKVKKKRKALRKQLHSHEIIFLCFMVIFQQSIDITSLEIAHLTVVIKRNELLIIYYRFLIVFLQFVNFSSLVIS